MDSIELDSVRRVAGQAYLKALEALGLHPDALFWAHDKTLNEFVLVLVTEMFDYKGPLAIAQVLFKAYNVAATPKEIDPFMVRLHSPDQAIIRQLDVLKDPYKLTFALPGNTPRRLSEDEAKQFVSATAGDLECRPDWIYRFELPPHHSQMELRRKWRRLELNMDKLAA